MQTFGKELTMGLRAPVQVEAPGDEIRMREGEGSASVDRLLVATGRTSNTEALDLNSGGIALDKAARPRIDP